MIEDSVGMLKLKLYIKEKSKEKNIDEEKVIENLLNDLTMSTKGKIAEWMLLGGDMIKKDNVVKVQDFTVEHKFHETEIFGNFINRKIVKVELQIKAIVNAENYSKFRYDANKKMCIFFK